MDFPLELAFGFEKVDAGSVSSSLSDCIANLPSTCGTIVSPFTGECGLWGYKSDCWCDDLCIASNDSKCCDPSVSAYVITIIIIILLILPCVWYCCSGRCPCCPDPSRNSWPFSPRKPSEAKQLSQADAPLMPPGA